MLKEKQEGMMEGAEERRDDKQGLWGFHPAFLLILIIYGFLKSHQNMMIQKNNNKKQNWMFLVAYFKGEAIRVLRCKNNEPQGTWNKQQYLNHKLFFIYDSFLEVDQ